MQHPRILGLIEGSLQTNGHPRKDVFVSESAVLLIDNRGQIFYASRESPHLLGMPLSKLLGAQLFRLIPALSFEPNGGDSNLTFINPEARQHDWQRVEVNHRTFSACISPTQMFRQEFAVVELRHVNAPQTEWHLQRLIQTLGDWDEMLVVTDTTGNITYVNQAFEDMTGFSFVDVVGKTQEQLLGCEKNRPLYGQMWSRLRVGKSFRAIFYSRKNKAQRFYEERYARPFVSEDGQVTHYVFTSRDVSERERLMLHLAHLANHDELTGLPNRHLFMDRLQQAQAHAARAEGGFCLLLLDLDEFKAINDQYGHAAGDAVLMEVANRLRACVREADTIARLGGDEFAIILSDTSMVKDVQQVLNKIIVALRKPIRFVGLELPSYASIGVAYYPQDSLDIDNLLNYADIAMYHVKAAGGNGYDAQQSPINNGEPTMRRRRNKFSPGQIDVRQFVVEAIQTNKASKEEEME